MVRMRSLQRSILIISVLLISSCTSIIHHKGSSNNDLTGGGQGNNTTARDQNNNTTQNNNNTVDNNQNNNNTPPLSYPLFSQWGTPGNGNSQFISPFMVAVDLSGNVYVTDSQGGNDGGTSPINNRVEKFDRDGNYLTQWGTYGTGNGQFNSPTGIAVDSVNNFVYVADYHNNRIQKFDTDGTYLTQWGTSGSGTGQFNGPVGVALDSSNNVYVADLSNNRVQEFDSNGGYIAQWQNPDTTLPFGIAIDPISNVGYLTSIADSRIHKFLNGNGLFGSGGQFGTGVGVDHMGNVYAPNALLMPGQGAGVQKLDSTGTFLIEYGSHGGTVLGQFNVPVGVAINIFGEIYVTDYFNARVQKIVPAAPIETTPTVTGVSPNTAVFHQGWAGFPHVTITGTNLSNPSAVYLEVSGSFYKFLAISSSSDTSIDVLMPTSGGPPSLPVGTYDIVVQTGDHISAINPADVYTVTTPPPPPPLAFFRIEPVGSATVSNGTDGWMSGTYLIHVGESVTLHAGFFTSPSGGTEIPFSDISWVGSGMFTSYVPDISDPSTVTVTGETFNHFLNWDTMNPIVIGFPSGYGPGNNINTVMADVGVVAGPADAVAFDKAALGIIYAFGDSASSVTQDVGFTSTGPMGSTITWTTDNLSTISNTGSVTRPVDAADIIVTITATISNGGVTDTKDFVVTVKNFHICAAPSGGIYYVTTSVGSDLLGTGSTDCPFATIQKAIDTMVIASISSGEVHVAAGDYLVANPVGVAPGISLLGGYSATDWNDRRYLTVPERSNTTYRTAIRYVGNNVGSMNDMIFSPSIDASNSGITDSTLVEGFTIDSRDTGDLVVGIFITNGANPKISYNTISGAASPATNTIAIASLAGQGYIDHNQVTGGAAASNINGGIGLMMANNVVVEYNVINGGASFASTSGLSSQFSSGLQISFNDINGGTAPWTNGMWFDNGVTGTIDSNTISGGNALNGTTGISLNHSSNPTITNNTINGGSASNVVYGIFVDNSSSPAITSNTINGGVASDSINGTTNGIYVNNSSNPIITSNTINGGAGGSYSTAINAHVSTPFITSNTIDGGSASVDAYGISLADDATAVHIHSNDIYGGVGNRDAMAIIITNGSSTEVINNVLRGGQTSTRSSHGVLINGATNTFVLNNTIIGGTGPYVFGVHLMSSGTAQIDNNIFYSATGLTGGQAISTSVDYPARPTTIRNNDFYWLTGGAYYCDSIANQCYGSIGDIASLNGNPYVTASNNVEGDPVFVNASLLDFHLTAGSPSAVTEGGLDLSASGVTLDKDGAPRTVPFSIGAYELDP